MPDKLRVLLVPDTIFWVTGTIARSILEYVPVIEGVVCSGTVVLKIIEKEPEWLEQFDLIHIICPHSSRTLLPYFSKRKPVVTTIHHVVEWRKMEHNLAGDMIMTLAEEWKRYLMEKGIDENKVMLVHNGVNSKKFIPASPKEKEQAKRRIGFDANTFVIGFFAKRQQSDFDRKGIETFEEAIRQLSKLERKVAVLLVGPGWNSLVTFFKDQGVMYKWFPYLEPHDQIIELYSALDCYWITSRIEGGPVTLLEAMSCGIPCISTPVGLSIELIENGETGFLIEKGDVNDLVEKTILLMKNKKLCDDIGLKARAAVAPHFDYTSVLNPIPELYSKAIENFESSNSQIKKFEKGGNGISLKNWMKREEDLQWLAILRNLGETKQAFSFGLKAIIKYPDVAFIKLQLKVIKDLILSLLR
jgi:glycosyltransferase involved in cell wall biosynthesis